MTEDECTAENTGGTFPMWSEQCSGICLCEEKGEGCYKGAPTHQCDCSPEMCKGGKDMCEETEGYQWSTGCGSCQCPTLPACKPRLDGDVGGPGGDDDDDDDDGDSSS